MKTLTAQKRAIAKETARARSAVSLQWQRGARASRPRFSASGRKHSAPRRGTVRWAVPPSPARRRDADGSDRDGRAPPFRLHRYGRVCRMAGFPNRFAGPRQRRAGGGVGDNAGRRTGARSHGVDSRVESVDALEGGSRQTPGWGLAVTRGRDWERCCAGTDEPSALTLRLHRLVETASGSGQWRQVESIARWEARGTAVVICDMWDKHWCQGATARVAEMAPRMNELIVAAAQAGRARSSTAPARRWQFYKDTPGASWPRRAPAVTPKVPLQGLVQPRPQPRAAAADRRLRRRLRRPAPLPAAAARGARRSTRSKIEAGDAITDSAEAYNLMHQRGIDERDRHGRPPEHVRPGPAVRHPPDGLPGQERRPGARHDRHDVQLPPHALREPLQRHRPGRSSTSRSTGARRSPATRSSAASRFRFAADTQPPRDFADYMKGLKDKAP